MPTNIPFDFKPDANSYANLRKHGAIPEFVDSQLDFFITYWTEKAKTGCKSAKKESWQMTLQTWMRRAWNGRVGREWEKSRHYQTRAPSKGDPFESALDLIQGAEPEKPKPEPKYRFIKPEQPAETMTAEEAFAELARMRARA